MLDFQAVAAQTIIVAPNLQCKPEASKYSVNAMEKNILRIAAFSLLAAAIAVAPTQTLAQKKKDEPAAEKKGSPTADRGILFRGKIAALDKTAKTVTVEERVFQINASTVIRKAGKPATRDAVAAGEEIGGTPTRRVTTAKMLRFGPKPEGEPSLEAGPNPKAKERKGGSSFTRGFAPGWGFEIWAPAETG